MTKPDLPADQFTVEPRPAGWTIRCKGCTAAWTYPNLPLGAGAILELLNHFASHERNDDHGEESTTNERGSA